jgi:hypothetical protein
MKVLCSICGKEIEKKPKSYLRWSRLYCSRKCQFEGQKKNSPIKCSVCGKSFYCSPSQQRLRNRQTCSLKCKAKMMETKQLGKFKNRRGMIHKLQQLVQKYARLRDCGGMDGKANCISCNRLFKYEELDGGHFIPKTSSSVMFDERNINAQCRKCNRFLSGNSRHYSKGMVKKYGQATVDELESLEFTPRKWTTEEIYNLIEKYKKLADLNEKD